MSPYFGMLPLVFKALEVWCHCWALEITQIPVLLCFFIVEELLLEVSVSSGLLLYAQHIPRTGLNALCKFSSLFVDPMKCRYYYCPHFPGEDIF